MKKTKIIIFFIITVALVFSNMVLFPVSVSANTIAAYPMPSIYSSSTVYSLKANTTTIPVVSYTGDYDYAEFSMSAGATTIEITALGQSSITSYSISPKKLGLTGTTSGNKLTFTINNDEYLIVKINNLSPLVIAADPGEVNAPAASGTGIYNVKNAPYNADSTGATMATTAIQNAINDAANFAGGQGIVFVPAGVYKIGNLQLKSDVALYLQGGSVLRFTGVKSDYTVNWHKDSQNRDITWWLYTPTGANNVKIYGRGTIDGNGKYATETNNFASNIIVPMATTNFTLDGPIIRDSGSWAITPARSNDLTFKNFKIFNRLNMGENDGIDVNESQNVVVQHAIGIGLDDPFTTKTWDQATDISLNWPGNPEVVSNVVFDDLISWTVCYGYKVGQGMRQNQSGVTFKNSVVYDAAVGIGIDHKYGVGALSGVTFDNIDIEKLSYTNDSNRTWALFAIRNGDNSGGGTIDNINVKNITVRDKGTTAGVLKGYSSTKMISGITFDNVVMPGSAIPAQNLFQLNMTNKAFYTGVTILPTQIPEPIQRMNLALNKVATASSSKAVPSYAVDGNLSTRWGSNYTDSEWIYVDLGSTNSIDGVRLNWEAAYGKSYQIQVSNDASTWTNVYSTTTGDGGIDDINFAAVNARYVRMNGTLRGSVYGYSLWEFEVYAAPTPATSITSGKTYRIDAKSSLLTVGVENASTTNGARVIQWNYGTGQNDQWMITTTTAGYYKIINMHSGKSMAVQNASTVDGAAVIQWDFGSTGNDQWQIVNVGGNYFKLINKFSGKALNVANNSVVNGGALIQWTYAATDNMLFQLFQLN